MVQLIVGPKGSGKTGKLVDELNQLASENKNVVCIQSGKRLDESVKYSIRLINSNDYPVNDFPQLLGFVAGICAKDYDLDALYIDSIHRVSKSNCKESLLVFLENIETFTKDKLNVVMTLSIDPSELDERFDRFVRK